jgi:uncharacterized OsmC-like protein
MSTLTTEIQTIDQKLNETISGVIKHVKENPDAKDVSFNVKSKLEKGFHTEINVRDFQFISDEPESLGGENKGPNPVEYVLGALAACQEIVIKAYAGQLGIELKSINVEASGDLDLQGFFNLSDERPGFNNVRYKTVISTEETDPAKLQLLKDFSTDRCPVLDIISNPVPVNGEVVYVN